jgi:phosphoserine phosphatase
MRSSRKITVALIYDFDGTLSPGNMQEFGFIQAIQEGKNTKKAISEFWKKNKDLSEKNDANGILCYMWLMLEAAKYKHISLKKDSFEQFGAKIELFSGVKEWFSLINKHGKELNIEIKHYINSSGLKEMIEGTPIRKEFENIYACSFLYDENGVAYWPAVAVDYTAKTQFLFKINKGIAEVSDNYKVNQFIPEENRPIPFKNMIFFGDGETDIPCMKMIKENGGHSIAVYKDSKKKKTALKLINENRVNFVCKADYSEEKDIHKVVKRILNKIRADYDFERLLELHKQQAQEKE